MLDPSNIPSIEDNEQLARYVTQKNQYRRSDNTVKQDLFMPHPRQELSVTRHREATESELWAVGFDVASKLGKNLRGRADIKAVDCKIDGLQVIPKPILPENPNHADIEGWPVSKEDKKVIALKLAASASQFIPAPS